MYPAISSSGADGCYFPVDYGFVSESLQLFVFQLFSFVWYFICILFWLKEKNLVFIIVELRIQLNMQGRTKTAVVDVIRVWKLQVWIEWRTLAVQIKCINLFSFEDCAACIKSNILKRLEHSREIV